MKPLRPHHQAWLDNHPHRSEEWLRSMFMEGFDIHHIDGNRDNNSPQNLVLIEHTDHMMLHGVRTLGRVKALLRRPGKIDEARDELAGTVYRTKLHGWTWAETAKRHGIPSTHAAMEMAKSYAARHNAPWPIPKA